MNWFRRLFMSDAQVRRKKEEERLIQVARENDLFKRKLRERRVQLKQDEENQRRLDRINHQQRNTPYQDRSDDFLNPLNPLSPISPISIWQNHDQPEEHRHHNHDTPQEDHHHHSHSNDNDYSSHHSHDDHNSSYDNSSDSSSYDSSDSGSSGDSGGGGD